MYMGLESLPLSSEDTLEARRQMPKGMIRGTLFVVIVSVLHIVIVSDEYLTECDPKR
jgi:amino acid transporter